MAKKYYNNELIAILGEEEKLYTKACLNIKGDTREGNPCVEVLAKNIAFSDIEPYRNDLKETFSYKREKRRIDTKSEKGLCRCWVFNEGFDESAIVSKLGKPIQYEINLINYTKVNIDLVSYKESENTLYLIEVKGRAPTKKSENPYGNNFYFSPESLLRCALEIRTYHKTLLQNMDKFKNDMGYPNAKVKLAVLIPEDSEAALQFKNPQKYPCTNKFITGTGDLENPEIEVVLFEGKEKKEYKDA